MESEVIFFTPRELESQMKRGCSKPGEVETLYASRDAYVSGLKKKGMVTTADLLNLDRLGRFVIADDYWRMCTLEARKALLIDDHHQVRSAAIISKVKLDSKKRSWE